ncbi:MAG: OmpH family outer membrane protein [Flavobacteriaceae bacterium]|nr:OmpH family outer membrane protein [Flavobacteriaceae bacterium]
MKKLLVVFSMIMFLTSCNQTKIAYVDVEEILKEYEGSKEAEKEMKLQSEKIATELDQLAKSFQQKVQEYQSNTKNLSEKAKKEKEQALMQEQQMIQQRQQMAQQQMQSEGQKKMEKINKEIDTFIEDYAKSNGISFILGTSNQTKSVLYGEEKLNITDDIVTALNGNYVAQQGNDNIKEELEVEPVN